MHLQSKPAGISVSVLVNDHILVREPLAPLRYKSGSYLASVAMKRGNSEMPVARSQREKMIHVNAWTADVALCS